MNAAQYDAWYDSPLGMACFASEAALLRRGAGDVTGQAVLDVGCGSGRVLRTLGQDAARAVGIDRNIAMLEIAQRRMSPELAPRYTWMAGDALAIPFADGSFDVVFENTLLCFCADPVSVIQEMVRVCRPDGVVLLGELNPVAPWQWWRRLKAAVGKGSFRGAAWHRPRDLLTVLATSGCQPHVVGRAIFAPPLNIQDRLHWREAAEWVGTRLWPWAGAYYVLKGTRRDYTKIGSLPLECC